MDVVRGILLTENHREYGNNISLHCSEVSFKCYRPFYNRPVQHLDDATIYSLLAPVLCFALLVKYNQYLILAIACLLGDHLIGKFCKLLIIILKYFPSDNYLRLIEEYIISLCLAPPTLSLRPRETQPMEP